MKIDRDLQDLRKETPAAVVEVVLVCKSAAPISDADLASCGFHLEETQRMADVAFIHGKIKLADLDKLSAMPGIESVSSAPDAEIC